MGCGRAKATAVVVPSVPHANLDNQTQEIVCAALKKSITHSKPGTSQVKSKSPSLHSEHETNQNFIILWVDSNMDESKKTYQKSITKLHRLTTLIITYKHIDRCVVYLNSIEDKRIFLIVSYHLGKQPIGRIHDKSILKSIYIYSEGQRQKLL